VAERVVFDGKHAVGVRFRQNGGAKIARCRGEVILSAGSIGSIQTLLLSGVGPAQQLQQFGIRVVVDKPGVGENLQDHLQLRLIYRVSGAKMLNEAYHSPIGFARMLFEYAVFRRGPLTMAPSHLGIFTRSDPRRERANIQFYVQPLSLDRFGQPLHTFPAFTASIANVQPRSRGFVRMKSPDPTVQPAIQPNYLSTDEDRRVAADSIRLTRRIVAQPALKQFQPIEYVPGKAACGENDADLMKAASDIGTTVFHPVGTVYVMSRSLLFGSSGGLMAVVAVALGSMTHMLMAAFGISALVVGVPHALDVLRAAGAVILAYLAWKALVAAPRRLERQDMSRNGVGKTFGMGVVISLLNPTIALLYLTLLPQFIDPARGSVFRQTLLLGTAHILIGIFVNSAAVIMANGISQLSDRPNLARLRRLFNQPRPCYSRHANSARVKAPAA
jgi:threonine/homoserine/homoserine lactone efflux protein